MAGEDAVAKTASQISLLLGEPVTPDQPVALRSVHRAALSSWARKQGIALNPALIGASAPFTIMGLLSLDGSAAAATPLSAPARPVPASPAGAKPISGGFTGVGIDMEDVSSLPEATDFREHPFYKDNFTPAEISYCLRQADVASAFCGTWAAKEAILKSGLVSVKQDRLDGVEIRRDPQGRPVYDGCALSISHTKTAAVAICLVAHAVAPTPELPIRSPVVEPVAPPPPSSAEIKPSGRWSLAPVVTACIGVVVGGGVVFLAGHL